MERDDSSSDGCISSKKQSSTTTQRFIFTATDVHFWTVGPSKVSRNDTNPADISNPGDQLRYFKQEQNMRRRHLYECSLRNSEHNLHSVRAGCATPLETSMYATSASRGRQSSEPNVHLIHDRIPSECRMKHMSGSKDNGKEVKRNQEEQTSGNTERSEWESWMRSQPLSVLKLDRTERLVLRIGETLLCLLLPVMLQCFEATPPPGNNPALQCTFPVVNHPLGGLSVVRWDAAGTQTRVSPAREAGLYH
ncbi:hypothetical protein Tcan_14950 [Toxocara canis]|uniref:Uncharacterized protein n=1 Tax=Toxocara canis TaxID=6265 RepID=A0A0B2V556_TOXCA|nr:hypothetical protein Tcan_14950 [Toxocara canis]